MMAYDIKSIPETAYGFRSKLIFFAERIEFLRKKLSIEKKEIKILDVGCGNGSQVTLPLSSQGYSLTGIDMHEPSIEFARSNNEFNARFLLNDIADLKKEIGREKFHAIIFSDVLEHVENPQELICDAVGLLEDGGILLISIPNGYGPFEIENYILRKLGIIKAGRWLRKIKDGILRKKHIPYNVESGHVQFFTRKTFEKILSKNNLKISFLKKGCFLGGSVSNAVISRFSFLTKLNIRITKHLPSWICSVWYFECKKI